MEYLAAKRTVDDRALDRHVWDRFVSTLEADADGDPIRILEVGAGIATMVARLATWGRLDRPLSYRAVDLDATCIDAGRRLLPDWLERAGYDVERRGERLYAWDRTAGRHAHPQFEITLEVADATTITDAADAVVGAAVFDIVDLETMLVALRDCLRPGGLLYAPCTFAGTTTFVPRHPLDDRIERHYHRHMDDVREQPGGSRAGQQLIETAPELGYEHLAVGGADWVILPRDGEYRHNEGVVLEHLLETIDDALADVPESVLESSVRNRWLEHRRRQLERTEFGMIVHHLDVLARL
ncbi:class I SAM-dependent methyltransferase [Salinadaptatus halalkaliphilus]|uniref:Class I SAM-dependent methyltransferase n=1 Tax=Salinadaptatus halalkaliphilus TaxID=2419781 RepID=A0A4S3TP80_9EURY|nr:class I SAM-dependent methyltransferase [Salinadaptatus halalkaliphilus]